MKGTKNTVGLFAALMAMNGTIGGGGRNAINNVTYKPVPKVIPRGCKEYHFDSECWLVDHPVPGGTSVIAINEKNARRKNFKNLQDAARIPV